MPRSDPAWGKAHPCQCKREEIAANRATRLQAVDGLQPSERMLRFDGLGVDADNREAIEAVRQATAAERGIVTLSGPPGTGKSTLLICAVNKAREAGVTAIYMTVVDLLDWLRKSFDRVETIKRKAAAGEEVDESDAATFEERWNLLVTAPVLALDELDEFRQSDWALERFHRLIDERWRSMDERLTLLATNAQVRNLTPRVASRLLDGRARVVRIAGADLRPDNAWWDR